MDISIILSGLALLAAVLNFILTLWEKKRNEKQNADMLQFIKNECRAAKLAAGKYTDEQISEKNEETDKKLEEIDASISFYDEEFPGIKKNIQELMQGIVPDYNEAVKAKDAVDNFSRDIAALLNFDPLEAAKSARNRRRNGGEVSE